MCDRIRLINDNHGSFLLDDMDGMFLELECEFFILNLQKKRFFQNSSSNKNLLGYIQYLSFNY